MKFEAKTLSMALMMTMVQRGVATRDLARVIGTAPSTAWRATRHPARTSDKVLGSLIRWLGCSNEEFLRLWIEEFKLEQERSTKVLEEVLR